MAFAKSEHQFALSVSTLLILSTITGVFCVGSAACAQTQRSSDDESWTATTERFMENTDPSRTTQSHSKSGDHSVDRQRVDVLGLDGKFRPDSDTETETVRVNDTTIRTVVHTYRWDGNGRRILAQVTEEETRNMASGDGRMVRTTSNADVNGNLQVVKREVSDTRQTSPDVQETNTKVYLADGNGGFTIALRTEEQKKRSGEHSVEVKKAILLPDGNGNWKVGEVNEKTIKEDGKKRSTDERISRPDSEGRLSEFSRTVGEETESAGERSSTVESYFRNVPGSSDNGKMHRTQRVTTLQKKGASGETIEQQVEQPNPGNPSDGAQVTAKTKYTVRYAAAGSEKTKAVEVRDGNGNFKLFYVETRKLDQTSPAHQYAAPASKPF